MPAEKDIFSIRIVVADHYMCRPVTGLDPCYSEFRGYEIKSVPVIRIFGSNSSGEKTCMHIHGVFPYFYVPYDERSSDIGGSADRIIYQVASSVDKAVNISLGQHNSQQQHVFKVQLVKGIPFYGYHKNEHQYLKIYLYNPRFIRRVANLFQNGAILGNIFQPHESHVPYILQFFIDYNLYGMSFLYVPKEIVKFRPYKNNEEPNDINKNQILYNIPRVSISQHEIDVAATFILNRFQITSQSSTHTNPGIESIWLDEKIRRKKLSHENNEVPPLEVPCSNRENIEVQPTESDIFYRTGLRRKIYELEINLDQTLNSTILNNSCMERKSKFNLKKLLQNSIYPQECSQKEALINASFIQDHYSSQSLFHQTAKNIKNETQQLSQNSSEFSVIDEDLVLSLSQSTKLSETLRELDLNILEVMRQLEENEEDNENILEAMQKLEEGETEIDLDSTLAPLSQTPEVLKKKVNANKNLYEEHNDIWESDDDIENFSLIVDDIIDDTLSACNEKNGTKKSDFIPQLDGADDNLHTPVKGVRRNQGTNSKTPVTPKRRSLRYTPLQITITKSPKANKNKRINGGIRSESDEDITVLQDNNSENTDKIRSKNLIGNHVKELCNLRRSSRLISSFIQENDTTIADVESMETDSKPETVTDKIEIRRKISNQEKTKEIKSVTRNIKDTPIVNSTKKKDNFKGIKTESIYRDINENLNKETPFLNSNSNKRKRNKNELKIYKTGAKKRPLSKSFPQQQNSVQNVVTPIKSCLVKIKKLNKNDIDKFSSSRTRCRSPSDIAREYDRRNNFFPEPGPSHVNYYKFIDVPNPEITKQVSSNPINGCYSATSITKPTMDQIKLTPKLKPMNDSDSNSSSDPENDMKICSFYEKSFIMDSPSLFSDSSPGTSRQFSSRIKYSKPISCGSGDGTCEFYNGNTTQLIITPSELPPTFDEVKNNLTKFQIPEVKYFGPFYSKTTDVTQKKEIGSTILKISSNKLNDCEEFKSILGGLNGVYMKRRQILDEMFNGTITNQYKTNSKIKEYFCTQDKIIITTNEVPPSRQDAKIWLKARHMLQQDQEGNNNTKQNCNRNIEEDSPIKIRREKAKLILEDECTSSDDIDLSQKSLSLTPLTPLTPLSVQEVSRIDDDRNNFTPKFSQILNNCQKSKACLSLSRRLNEKHLAKCIQEEEVQSTESKEIQGIKCISQDKLIEDQFDKEKFSQEHQKQQHSQTSSQSNDSVTSDLVLAALEKSSFRNNINLDANTSSNEGTFGITGVTLNNTFGFKINLENLQTAKADIEFDFLSIMSLEIFVPTRENLKPNPEFDPILGLFCSIVNNVPENSAIPKKYTECILVMEKEKSQFLGVNANILYVANEVELLNKLLELCEFWDPDIFAGYEVEMNSWGYLMDRCRFLNINFVALLSRVPSQKVRDIIDEDKGQYTDLDVEMKLIGRILLDVWRLMRSEISLTSYTFENVMYHILHRRCPLHSFRDLSKWFSNLKTRWIVIDYYLERVNGTLELLEQLDLIGRTSEMAKLIGIQFYEVLSRGSQFRVESMMLRMAKPKNLVALSPSVQQRAHMRAPEYLPLILEPQSRFYIDPVIVLDFQSLYPSMIIAYNYCFSTCLGRVEHLGQNTPFDFGASQLRVSPTILKKLIEQDEITVSPCGAVFVKTKIRQGVLPRMLQEILDTRLMVKQSMKIHKTNSILQRVLHSRQLGLKLMANVTYGYTAANFSGRMPCVEVGDSVVSKGRETLERAIKLVEANEKWRVKVVYGDTDSMFVLVPGRSRADAFKIGEEIAEAVTVDNPQPVKLKLEKVYQPCILQTKKRYVGYMYESADQKDPVYEAKGIETVRRDGCPAVAKMLEKCLRILFETRDVSKIKSYVNRQFTKILMGKANIQDLIFAKEFRGKNGYKAGACVPALELTKKWLQIDPRSEPRRGERVPFIIINGPPGVPLIRLVRSPLEFLADEGLKINAIYYITKAIIPPLNRCLLLIGADVNEWFAELPRKNFLMLKLATASEIISNKNISNNKKKSTISQYFSSTNCVIDCGKQTNFGICSDCVKDSQKCTVVLWKKISKLERNYCLTRKFCESCCGRQHNIECESLDCPVLYVIAIKRSELKQSEHFQHLLEKNFLDF